MEFSPKHFLKVSTILFSAGQLERSSEKNPKPWIFWKTPAFRILIWSSVFPFLFPWSRLHSWTSFLSYNTTQARHGALLSYQDRILDMLQGNYDRNKKQFNYDFYGTALQLFQNRTLQVSMKYFGIWSFD